MDCWTGTTTPTQLRDLMKTWTDRYGIQEWRVEKNAFQIFLTQDPEVREYLASRGCLLVEHYTGSQKMDPAFGVASMAALFDGWKEKRHLVHLPSPKQNEGIKALVEQLVTWAPELPKRQKTDCVMALWFAELRAREICKQTDFSDFVDNPFLGDRERDARIVFDFDEVALSDRVIAGGWL